MDLDLVPGMEEDSVTNRVAGFTCKRALNKHTGSVTGNLDLVINSTLKYYLGLLRTT